MIFGSPYRLSRTKTRSRVKGRSSVALWRSSGQVLSMVEKVNEELPPVSTTRPVVEVAPAGCGSVSHEDEIR